MTTKITKVCILGERVSGTCFVQSLVSNNTSLKSVLPYGHKHFFQDVKSIAKADTSDTIFIFITRDVMEWLNSFKENTFHADKPIRNCKSMSPFLRMEWKCVYDSTSGTPETSTQYGQEMMCERDPSDGRRFENVVRMRNSKMRHFMGIRDIVDNFVHARYEDVREDPEKFIVEVTERFSISKSQKFNGVATVRGKGRVPYTRTIYPEMAAENVDFVVQNLDHEVEALLGYI